MPTEKSGTGKNLVIGMGQIGSAIREILQCEGHDPARNICAPLMEYDTLHICFPYSSMFSREVERYRDFFKARLVIVHSTVPVGTCDKLYAVHSPVRGIHPNLVQGIRTFVKYFGGINSGEAAQIFEDVGIRTKVAILAKDTEAMKLWDTTQYGLNIILEKAIAEYCKNHNLDFDLVYTDANRTYNEGYEALGHPEYKKYVLRHVDGKIGGHCVMPNLDLLSGDVADFIRKKNASL